MKAEFERAAALKTLLDAQDDQLTQHAKALEERLVKYINVRIAVTYTSDELLVFGKDHGHWCLHLERTSDGMTTPISSAPRGVRAGVFTSGVIEKLICEAPKQLDAMIEQRTQAIKAAQKLIETFDRFEQERKKP